MNSIRNIMREAEISQWGVCRYGDVLPLLEVRSAERIPTKAKSVIVILFGYYTDDYPNRNISRYAIPDDYHKITGGILQELAEKLEKVFLNEKFQWFIDQSPIPEVWAGFMAGLGEVGLNGQLINKVFGSYCFIGEIVTTKDLESVECTMPQPPKNLKGVAENRSWYSIQAFCNDCKKCLEACPSGALSKNGFEPSRCRSHITQKKGVLTHWEEAQVQKGKMAWGCDICNDCCPLNRTSQRSPLKAFYTHPEPWLTKENVGVLCKRKAYGWRGAKVLHRNLELISKALDSEPRQKDR